MDFVKYDDASWHYEGKYPKGLPIENAATHIGMFFKWCIETDLISEELREYDLEDIIAPVKGNKISGGQALWVLDGKFSSDELNDEGNRFAMDYYDKDDTAFAKAYSSYFQDYCDMFNENAKKNGFEYETLYHIEDTYENYLLLKPVLDRRLKQWKDFSNSNS